MHDSDLSGEAALLQWHIDDCRRYIEELETRLGDRQIEIRVCGAGMIPVQAHEDDAGFDLFTLDRAIVGPGEFADIQCGIRIELPAGYWAQIVGRSSTLRQRGLLVTTAVLDTGYRGPLFAGAWNLSDREVWVEPGERVAQLIIMPNISAWAHMKRVETLSVSERGERGFGSSGR